MNPRIVRTLQGFVMFQHRKDKRNIDRNYFLCRLHWRDHWPWAFNSRRIGPNVNYSETGPASVRVPLISSFPGTFTGDVSFREWRRSPLWWSTGWERGTCRSSRNCQWPQRFARRRHKDRIASCTRSRRLQTSDTSRAATARGLSWRRKEEHACVRTLSGGRPTRRWRNELDDYWKGIIWQRIAPDRPTVI